MIAGGSDSARDIKTTLQTDVIHSKAKNILALALALLFGCLGVGGCSYQYELSVFDLNTTTPRFQFTKPLLAPPIGRRHSVELNRFSVVAKSSQGWDYKNPVWEFERDQGSYAVAERITYGTIPSGFKEATAARPLSVGVPYQAIAFGAGGGGGIEFQLR